MTDEPSDNDSSSDYKKLAAIMGIAAAAVTVLVGLNSLTGFNPFHDLIQRMSTPAASQVSTVAQTPEESQKWTPPPITTTTTKPAWLTHTSFYVESKQWDGLCNDYVGCHMSAIFRNGGGEGAASATFYILPNDGNFTYLAYCSVVIPSTPHGSVTSAGCAALSDQLRYWLKSGRSGIMYITIRDSDL